MRISYKNKRSTYLAPPARSKVDASIVGAFQKGTADEFNVIVKGGTVEGANSIVGGAINGAGKIGNVNIDIKGGNIAGSVYGGSFGSAAEIGKTTDAKTGTYRYGSITADHVVLQKVAPSDTQHGMDKYEGTISAKKITLDTINTSIRAFLCSGVCLL